MFNQCPQRFENWWQFASSIARQAHLSKAEVEVPPIHIFYHEKTSRIIRVDVLS